MDHDRNSDDKVNPVSAGSEYAAENSPGLLAHIAELRGRLIKSFLSIIPGFAISYNFAAPIIDFLVKPLKSAMPDGPGLIATGLPDTFFVHLKIGLWGGLLVSAPYWLFQVWSFIAPGLYQKEKDAAGKLAAMSFLLMAVGTAFAYFLVFPLAFKFFVGFTTEDISLLPTIQQYLSLVTTMILAFGLAFQLPLLLLFLSGLGLIDAEKLAGFRRYAVVLIVIIAAVLTPPDVVSQIMMAIPLMALYEISIVMIRNRIPSQDLEEGQESSIE